MPVRTPCLPREVAEASLGAVGARHEGMRRAPAGAPVRVSTSRSIKRAAAKASISRTRSVSARFSISSRRAILASVIVVSWFRFKLRNSNPNRRPAVTAPGVRCAQQGFAHALSGAVLHHARGHYGGAPHPGEIRIGDRNYARASVLQRFRAQSGGSADFIVRLGWNALQLTNPAGKPFDLIGYLQCLPTDQSPHEVNLRASLGRDEPALAVRLVVQRKTQEAAEATRSALRRTAARKGKALDPRSLIAADFMILATSLPKTGYSARAVLAVYRLRWQIELAFKRLKSLLHIDRLPTWTERGSRSWLYAHLILALLCDDLSQDFLDSSP